MQESLGDYRILEWIGAGGAAEVFRARDTRRGRTAAIKVLTSDLTDDPEARRLVLDDARTAAAISHPNIAALYDIGEQDGRPYLVFEFVQGQTLSALLAGRPINPRRAVEFAVQIADALADAHAGGLVHLALRPDKVIVSQKGTAKIIDFGLGKYASAVARRTAAAGTPVPAMAYWAPEQRSSASIDAPADIYALGLLLLEMLTGRPPASDGTPQAMAGVTKELQPIVSRMTTAAADRRHDSAATVAAELREVAQTLDAKRDAAAPPVATAARASSRALPRWLIVAAVLAAVAVLVWLAARS
jgi:serine/threonine protein kinase